VLILLGKKLSPVPAVFRSILVTYLSRELGLSHIPVKPNFVVTV
jgi:hypothetical protein